MIEIGKHVKVFLKGESPWAIVESIVDEKHITAKIDNYLVCTDMHGISYGDVCLFELREVVAGHPSWKLSV